MNEYNGYRPGDRIQMISCKDPFAPILPGERGTINYIDDAGTLHMRWDHSGRTLGVCLEEDEVRKIPIEQEWELLHTSSVMQCDEARFGAHCEETDTFLEMIDAYAAEKDGEWVVKSSFLDEAHKGKDPVFQLAGAVSLDQLIQGCDVKQGVDIAFTAKRPEKERSILLIAYGQNYSTPDGTLCAVTELLECKLVSPAVAKDFHERIEAGWDMQQGAVARLFSSAPDHENLSTCIRNCKAIKRDISKNQDKAR